LIIYFKIWIIVEKFSIYFNFYFKLLISIEFVSVVVSQLYVVNKIL